MKIATQDTRQRAIAAYQAQKGSQAQIAAMYGVTLRTFQRWWKQYCAEGSTAPKARGHRRAVFGDEDLLVLKQLIHDRSDATLEELRRATGKQCSIMAVQRATQKLEYSYKKNAKRQRTKSP